MQLRWVTQTSSVQFSSVQFNQGSRNSSVGATDRRNKKMNKTVQKGSEDKKGRRRRVERMMDGERWREMGKDKRIEEYEETERGKEGGKEERTEGRQRTKETKRGRKKPISIFDTVALPNAFSIFIFFGVVPTGTLFFFLHL